MCLHTAGANLVYSTNVSPIIRSVCVCERERERERNDKLILSRFKFVNGTRPGVISYPVISSRKILYVGLESVNC